MPEYRIVRHRGQFSLAFTDPSGRRVRVATGTDDRGLAEARARDIWRARTAPTSERVDDLWPLYVADRMTVAVQKDRFPFIWKALQPHFGHRLGKAITRADCKAYEEARKREGKAPSTIKTELEFLRACLRFHYGKDAPSIQSPTESKPRDRWLTFEERDKLLAAIETPHVRLFVILALTTGARMSALLELTWDRVDFKHKTVDLNPAGREITNKRRTIVPLNSRAWEAIEIAHKTAETANVIEYDGKPVKSVKKAIRGAAIRSGVPCSPHVFRHTAGVWMAQADVPMEKIAQFLGHTTSRITQKVYARFSPSFMRDASDALNW